MRSISGKNILDYLKNYQNIPTFENTAHQHLMEFATYSQLYQNIANPQNFPNSKKRQHATDPIDIVELKFIPWKKTTTLSLKAVARNGQRQYDVKVIFDDVKYKKVPETGTVTFTAAADNLKYHIHPINLSVSDVKVSCGCLDFYHRFSSRNFSNQTLVGRLPRQYVPLGTGPSQNVNNTDGVCKHIIALMRDLGRLRICVK